MAIKQGDTFALFFPQLIFNAKTETSRLHQSRKYFTPREAISSERDVLLQIEHFLVLLAISFDFFFVKGHQDDKKPPSGLDSPALANIHADSLASSALESTHPCSSVSFILASQCQPLV